MKIKVKGFSYEEWTDYVSQFVELTDYPREVIEFAWKNYPFPYDAAIFLLGYKD
ncbi:MAG TPA: hypothetical protein GX505_14315 [Clostridiales bacterium]|nr:hypothetical protein [Clostridiales bacterium]